MHSRDNHINGFFRDLPWQVSAVHWGGLVVALDRPENERVIDQFVTHHRLENKPLRLEQTTQSECAFMLLPLAAIKEIEEKAGFNLYRLVTEKSADEAKTPPAQRPGREI
jgi:hypothetical protein